MKVDEPVPGRCPVCREEMQQPVHCPSCATPHHQECWEYNHGCAIYACTPVSIIIAEEKVPVVRSYTVRGRRLGTTFVETAVMGMCVALIAGLFPEALVYVVGITFVFAIGRVLATRQSPDDTTPNALVPTTTRHRGFTYRFICNFWDNVRRGLDGYHDQDDWERRNGE